MSEKLNILKERKTPLQSKRKVVTMMELFEKYVDDEIVLIDIELGRIQTNKNNLYIVDIAKNIVQKIEYEKYKLEINEPFE